MAQHLLRVERPATELADLITTVQARGHRVGWLELPPAGDPETASEPLPNRLAAAAELGVLRAVAVGASRSVAVKPMRGAPVLRDLLREHFRGCTLVLVRGAIDAPLLEPRDGGFSVTADGADGSAVHHLTADRLAAALSKPRPW